MKKLKDILRIINVTKSFTRDVVNIRGVSENERFYIIEDLKMSVTEGKITALIGGNGAGKTTLFNIISGFIAPDRGDIELRYNGEFRSINRLPPYEIARGRFAIGRVFQDYHLFSNMTVLDNMLIADSQTSGENPLSALINFKRNRKIEIKRLQRVEDTFIELFGSDNEFWQHRDFLAKSLSYGQQRLLGLARLFIGDYKLVLLDEPTEGVNPRYINKIEDVIKRMVAEKNISVFLIEHNMDFVISVADFCRFMSHGKITAFGTPQDVLNHPDVRRTYLGI